MSSGKGALLVQNLNTRLSVIKKLSHLNVFITEMIDTAREQINESFKREEKGESLSCLDGLTFAAKDNLCTLEGTTTCASRFLSNYSSSYTSTAVQRLLSSGAVLIGKTNMDEFGMGSGNLNSYYGSVSHPDNPLVVSGGSSGGSAVAVSSGMCDFALGSDTGGSVRLPASLCGSVGIKPTYGRVSRHGLIPLASSMDTVGILANNVQLAANVLDCISGPDEHDSTSIRASYQSCDDQFSEDNELTNIRMGIPKECDIPELSSESRLVWRSITDSLASLGMNIVDVSLPHFHHSVSCYSVLCNAEVASNMAKYSGALYGVTNSNGAVSADQMFAINREEGLGDVIHHRIMAGTYFLSYHGRHHYEQALRVRRLILNDFQSLFNNEHPVNVLLMPVSLGGAPTRECMEELGPVESCVYDSFTVPANLTGLPAISVPTNNKRLPIGIQVMADWLDEVTMIKVAKVIESVCIEKRNSTVLFLSEFKAEAAKPTFCQ